MTQGRFLEKSFKKGAGGRDLQGRVPSRANIKNLPSIPRKIVNPRGQRKGK